MRRLGSVRVRTTLGATLVVGVVLVIGALVLVAALRRSLTADVENTARLRAEDVAALLEGGTPPGRMAVEDEDESAVQVVDRRGRVVASSSNVAGRPAFVAVPPDPGDGATEVELTLEETDHYRVVAARSSGAGASLTVLVARSLEPVDEGTGALVRALAVGLPLVVLVVAATTWVVTGRALRPVEAIRDEVGSITDDQLDRRVPEPPGADEIARLARTMNEMLARLETARARQQRFVSDASHELRSPIATVRHELELLVADPAHAGVLPVAEALLAECLRMQALVDDLLLLARTDETAPQRVRRAVDVDDLVLAAAARLRDRGTVRVETTGVSAGQVLGDGGQLARLVRNLADNAERHAARTVRFDLGAEDGQVVLAVADDGPGVPAAARAQVFERFTRLDEARGRDTGGAGLGLAIVAQVAASHGGTVGVDDAPGGGARFTVRLPAAGP